MTGSDPGRPAAGEVHVWRIPLPGSVEGLTEEERARAARFRSPSVAAEWATTRSMTRRLLAKYLEGPITFDEDADGKPSVVGSGVQFNLAHTSGLSLLAVAADRAVGVDVERIDPKVDRAAIGALAFDPSTARRLARASVCSFFAHWTRLEALGKCRGTGLREQMALDPRAGEVVVDIDAGPGYAAAVAVACGPVRIRLLTADSVGPGAAVSQRDGRRNNP